jgi:hypothetical protein
VVREEVVARVPRPEVGVGRLGETAGEREKEKVEGQGGRTRWKEKKKKRGFGVSFFLFSFVVFLSLLPLSLASILALFSPLFSIKAGK